MTGNNTFKVSCPGCGRSTKAIEEKFRGRKGRCPACRSVFILDDPPKIITSGPDIGPAMQSADMDATHQAPPAKELKADPDATRMAPAVTPETPDQADPDATKLAAMAAPDADSDATRLGKLTPAAHHTDRTRLALQAEHRTDGSEKDVPLAWQPGDRFLGTYRVEGILGRGAFGTVYRVRHLGWRMDLAVKSPNPEALDAHGANIFTSEAETWSELGLHPHIVSCYYVRNLGGIPRVFAEYVDGGSLQELIEKDGVGDLDKKLDIAIQFAWGLAYAHARDMVHKDVKPANVMLTADGRVKVTDFGLTRAKASRGAGEEVDIGGGRTIMVDGTGCTPAYASPEQLAGKPVSRAADAYSWAVSILAIFTGGASWRVGAAAPVVLEGLLNGTGEKSGTKTPRMPAALVDLLRECLAFDPDKRQRDMNVIADRLVVLYREITGTDYPLRPPRQDQALSADSLVNRALSLIDLDYGDRAETLLHEALTLQPHHPEATYNLGLLRWRAGEITDMDLVHELEEVRATHTLTWIDEFCLGLVHMERGDYETAAAVLDSIQEKRGKNDPQVIAAIEKCTAEKQRLQFPRIMHFNAGTHTPPGGFVLQPGELAAFSGNGGRMIVLRTDNTLVDLFAVPFRASGNLHISTFQTPGPKKIISIALNGDGVFAATGNSDQSINLWDVNTPQCLNTLRGHETTSVTKNPGITAIWISRDGKKILSCGEDWTIREWDAVTGACLRVMKGPGGSVSALDVDEKESLLVTGGYDGGVNVWDLTTGKWRNAMSYHGRQGVSAIRLAGDGKIALTGGQDGFLRVMDLKTGNVLYERKAAGYDLSMISLSPDDRYAITGGRASSLKLWDISIGRCLRTFTKDQHTGIPWESRTIFGGGFLGSPTPETIDFFEIYNGGTRHTARAWNFCLDPAPWLPSRITGSEAVSEASRKFEEEMKNAENAFKGENPVKALTHLAMARKQPGHEREPRAVELNRRMAMKLPRGGLSGAWLQYKVKAHSNGIAAIAVSRDGAVLVSGTGGGPHMAENHVIKVWDLSTGELLREFGDRRNPVWNLVLTPDDRRLVATHQGKDGQAVVWDLETGKTLFPLYCSLGVSVVCVSPDGRFAFGLLESTKVEKKPGGDSTVSTTDILMWELGSGKLLRTFDTAILKSGFNAETFESIYYLRLSHDGLKLFTRFSGHLVVWDVATGVPENSFKQSLSTPFFVYPGDRLLLAWDVYGKEVLLFDLVSRAALNKCALPRYQPIAITEDWKYAAGFSSQHNGIDIFELPSMNVLRSITAQPTATAITPDGGALVCGDAAGNLHAWSLDWDLEPRAPCDWDEAAEPYLQDFLNRCRPFSGRLPGDRQPSEKELQHFLSRSDTQAWTDQDFNRLMHTLGCAGLGFIRFEGILAKLNSINVSLKQCRQAALPEEPAPDSPELSGRGAPALNPQAPESRPGWIGSSSGFDTRRNMGIEMVMIPEGEFMMGSFSALAGDVEKPVHRVRVARFYMGRYPVTQKQWVAVMNSNPSQNPASENHPVENVSWEDAQAFIRRLNELTGRRFRLPTEAEWEYAARAGSREDTYGPISTIAWYRDNAMGVSTRPGVIGKTTTQAVGRKKPNRFGLYDMLGNVGEWCQDWRVSYSSMNRIVFVDPKIEYYRILRGGNFLSDKRGVRVSLRGVSSPEKRYGQCGFRLARDD